MTSTSPRSATDPIAARDARPELLHDAAGRVIGADMPVDATARKDAETLLRHTLERFELLAATAGRLLAIEDPQTVVDELCWRVAAHLDCEIFFNYLLDEGASRLRLNTCGGISPAAARDVEWLDVGSAICGFVVQQGCRFVAEDVQGSADPRIAMARSFGVQAYACQPLLAEGRALGTLSFGTIRRKRFRDDELELMKIVADQVAIAMERKLARQRLSESEQRFRLMANAAPAALWITGTDHARVFQSHGWCEYTGQPESAGLGFGWTRALHPDDRDPTLRQLLAAAERREPFSLDYRLRRADGVYRWANDTGRPRFSAGGEWEGYIGSVSDVHERRCAEEELRRHRDRLDDLVWERTAELARTHEVLRSSERMAVIGTLAAGLGHDMGNLLVPIRVRLEQLAAAGLGEHLMQDVAAIRTSAEYLQRLASGLRLLALDPERALPGESTELVAWWNDAEPILRNALPRGVRLLSDIAGQESWVAMPRAALAQAVFNLVQNAAEALRPRGHGTVRIEAERSGDLVRLSVSDDGPGMPPEIKTRCMEPFFTTKPRAISTGLGLVLVYGLTREVGGSVELDTEPGRGTKFTLVLRAGGPPAPALNPAGRLLRAFVAIEDARLRSFVVGELHGMTLAVGGSAEQADLVILDRWRAELAVPEQARVLLFDDAQDGAARSDRVVVLGPNPRIPAIRAAIRAVAADLACAGTEAR